MAEREARVSRARHQRQEPAPPPGASSIGCSACRGRPSRLDSWQRGRCHGGIVERTRGAADRGTKGRMEEEEAAAAENPDMLEVK